MATDKLKMVKTDTRVPRAIALFQGGVQLGDKRSNVSKVSKVMKEAAAAGVELVIFPELFITGYCVSDQQADTLAEAKDGETFHELSKTAKEVKIAVLYGYIERVGDKLFNSAMVVSCEGSCVANCRKMHLWGEREKRLFTAGSEIVLVDLKGLLVGVTICYDFRFPELPRVLALRGAHLIVSISAAKKDTEAKILPFSYTRAVENCVYFAYSNYHGIQGETEFNGGSNCVDPHGNVLVESFGQECLLLAFVDPQECGRTVSKYLTDRRPDMYGELVKTSP